MLAKPVRDFSGVMRHSLSRLQADSGFRALAHELREEGWLDWQVLTGAYGIVLNVRLAAKGLNTREVVLDPRRRAETRRLAFEPETDQDPEVSLDRFTREGVDRGRAVALLSLVQHWDLECPNGPPTSPPSNNCWPSATATGPTTSTTPSRSPTRTACRSTALRPPDHGVPVGRRGRRRTARRSR